MNAIQTCSPLSRLAGAPLSAPLSAPGCGCQQRNKLKQDQRSGSGSMLMTSKRCSYEKEKEKDNDKRGGNVKDKLRSLEGTNLDALLQRLPGCVTFSSTFTLIVVVSPAWNVPLSSHQLKPNRGSCDLSVSNEEKEAVNAIQTCSPLSRLAGAPLSAPLSAPGCGCQDDDLGLFRNGDSFAVKDVNVGFPHSTKKEKKEEKKSQSHRSTLFSSVERQTRGSSHCLSLKRQIPERWDGPLSGQAIRGKPLGGQIRRSADSFGKRRRPEHFYTPWRRFLGCLGSNLSNLGFTLPFFHLIPSSYTMSMKNIHSRSKKNQQSLLEGLSDRTGRRVRRPSRELFPSPERLLQPSPERTLGDASNVVGPFHFTSIAMPRDNTTNMVMNPALIHLVQSNQLSERL
ncbi:hypothetical protein V8G54_037866 (chloroplast) [Vigna mungo]|uniref:Uncharacterized protein n=1 Tax=Vigna mungo TaxID=3915 RepID=A0AAQ3ME72_VIGMU